jgi:tetratricopeptide (TPR) repeat protein
MFAISEKLYDRFEFATFQAMDEVAQQQNLAQKLRTERHLLILDNLESIQGGYFAVKNTLSAEEQAKVKAFLAELRGAVDPFQEQTIVLLGSRSPEEWLTDASFKKNVYDLGGLDTESTTQFAEEILRQNKVPHYRNEEDFKKLLKLLAGFPLPMKVVLENLKRQTPSEILAALQAGAVNFRTGTAEEKTEDILKCIEYSHSNIAPEKQELLLCLAPFTSVVIRTHFQLYIEKLKQHEVLAHLNHELWDEVFTESAQRGLMSQDEKIAFVYHLQPILPYFLKTELQKVERIEIKEVIKITFRDYYNAISSGICDLLNSKEATKRIIGQNFASLEFENIDTCLEYSLSYQTSIENPFSALSDFYDSIQNPQAGLDLATKVLEKIEDYPSEILNGEVGIELIVVLDKIAKWQRLLKRLIDAENSYLKVLELHFKNQNLDYEAKRRGSASIYHNLGTIAQELRQWDKATDYYKQALQIKTDFNERYNQVVTLINLGTVSLEQAKWQESENYYQEALYILEESNDLYVQATIYHNLGLLAQRQEQLDNAENYYQQALEILINLDTDYQQLKTLHQLGGIAQRKGNWQEAENYYQEALKITIEFNDRYNQAPTYYHLGLGAQLQGDFHRANSYYQQSLTICIEFNDFFNQGRNLLQLGLLRQEQKLFSESQHYLLQALKIFIDINDEQNELIAFSLLRNAWKTNDDGNLLSKVGKIVGLSESEVQKIFENFPVKNLNEKPNIE